MPKNKGKNCNEQGEGNPFKKLSKLANKKLWTDSDSDEDSPSTKELKENTKRNSMKNTMNTTPTKKLSTKKVVIDLGRNTTKIITPRKKGGKQKTMKKK